MLVTQLIRLLQMLGLVSLQVLVMNHIHLLGYATPLVYVVFLLYFPLNTSRVEILLWSFALGLIVDIFSNTPGIASSAMTLAGMVRPPLLSAIVSKDVADNMSPNYHTLGWWTHARFILILVLIHHITYFALESFSFFNPVDLGISCASSIVLSLLIIYTLEIFRIPRS